MVDTAAGDQPRTRALAAVLLDMDGTILDSEKVWEIGLDELAATLGGTLSAPARASMVGSNLERSIRILHEDLGIEADEAASARLLLARTATLFATELQFKPGAEELLHELRAARIPMALVTSTQRGLTDIALDWIGRDYFAASVCGDEVPRPKPDAAPYLQAAALLGVDATLCVAIEDSPIGIAAAEAAHCVVLAVPSEVPIAVGPHRTVRSSLSGLSIANLRDLVDERTALTVG